LAQDTKDDRFQDWLAEDGCPAGPEIATNRFRAGRNFNIPGNRVKEISVAVTCEVPVVRVGVGKNFRVRDG